jgi:hypothetical protein
VSEAVELYLEEVDDPARHGADAMAFDVSAAAPA